MTKEFFITDNLAFVATAILVYPGKVQVKRVVFHPEKRGVKNFYLAPYDDAQKIFLEYCSDVLRISPAQLTSKISTLKGILAETTDNT